MSWYFSNCRFKVLIATDKLQEGIDVDGANPDVQTDLTDNNRVSLRSCGRTDRPGVLGDTVSVISISGWKPNECRGWFTS
ncbi:helicase-related protein [Bifidobacterium sp. ESL0825]|uniref:helicase-related protein n=1 Tax=Bifidobacterium sp. ESL0825 TaxID=3448587 RepID=UPI004041577E